MVGYCELEEAVVAEGRVRDKCVGDGREVEEGNRWCGGRGCYGGGRDLVEDFGAWGVVSWWIVKSRRGERPSLTSKMARKIALSIMRGRL